MPLAVCCLTALLLLDRCDASFLHPSLTPHLSSLVHQRVTLNAAVLRPMERTVHGARLVVSVPEKVLLTTGDPGVFDGLEENDRIQFTTRLKRPVRFQNPGQFDYRRYLERRGILLTGFVGEGDLSLIEKPGESTGHGLVETTRTSLNLRLDQQVGGEEGGLLKAFLTGDRSGLTEATWENFRKTGTAHLIAISGQHVAIVAGGIFIVLFWLLKRSERLLLRFSAKKIALAAAIAPVVFYTLIAGAPPSAVRAAILFAMAAVAVGMDLEADALSALSLAAVLIAIADPSAPFTASFQLSFLAVLGIIAFRERVSRCARKGAVNRAPTRTRRYFIEPFWITLGATLATAPLVAYQFHQVSISGILTNLWAVPAAGVVLTAGGLALLASFIIPPAGGFLLKVAGLTAHWFLAAIQLNSHWSWVVAFYPTEGETALCFAAVGLVAWIRQRPRQWRTVAAAAVLLLGSVFVPKLLQDPQEIEVTFLDVGQGDAALVVAPGGKTLLIDAGGFLIPFGERKTAPRFDIGRDVVVPFLKRKGIRSIDAILLSHPHPDHYGGLKAVMDEFPVHEFWWNGQTFPDVSFDRLLESLERQGTPRKVLKRGDRFDWSGCEVEVVYPERIRPGRSINDNSLVVRIRYGGASVLFPGDIEGEGERALADKIPIEATILKVPHHASRTSSSVPFIDSVRPQYAVASLSDGNLFGFPHEGILEKYERRGVKVFRTDRDGAVTFKIKSARDSPRRPISIRSVSSEGSP